MKTSTFRELWRSTGCLQQPTLLEVKWWNLLCYCTFEQRVKTVQTPFPDSVVVLWHKPLPIWVQEHTMRSDEWRMESPAPWLQCWKFHYLRKIQSTRVQSHHQGKDQGSANHAGHHGAYQWRCDLMDETCRPVDKKTFYKNKQLHLNPGCCHNNTPLLGLQPLPLGGGLSQSAASIPPASSHLQIHHETQRSLKDCSPWCFHYVPASWTRWI